MINESKRGSVTRITMWSGQDGAVPLESDLVGVEFRGRLGHPSSFGLLIGKSSPQEPGVLIDSKLSDELLKVVSVAGDRAFDGVSEPEYCATIRASAQKLGLCIVAAVAGEISSSRIVFSRLSVVLSAALSSPSLMLSDDQVWSFWDAER